MNPRVRVLLATYNGAQWVDEQLRSIHAQEAVQVHVVASDDRSSDATPQILDDWSRRAALDVLPDAGARFGSAHRNFLRLIAEAPLGDADFVALADQDDIWLPRKLARAVEQLQSVPAEAYSSDVVAFWPDGRRQLIRKSQPQRRQDYLFGSPGPGCTFVLTRRTFEDLRAWVRAGAEGMQDIWVHDWLIYAFVRSRGHRWVIDDHPNMLYRQHGRNEIGVNTGWNAARSRWRHVRTGNYRRDILGIAAAIGERSPTVDAIRRLGIIDRLWLVAHARAFRRRWSEALVLAAFIVCMPRLPLPRDRS